jgi:hypothetical protein
MVRWRICMDGKKRDSHAEGGNALQDKKRG